jgi:hypothetical protein
MSLEYGSEHSFGAVSYDVAFLLLSFRGPTALVGGDLISLTQGC